MAKCEVVSDIHSALKHSGVAFTHACGGGQGASQRFGGHCLRAAATLARLSCSPFSERWRMAVRAQSLPARMVYEQQNECHTALSLQVRVFTPSRGPNRLSEAKHQPQPGSTKLKLTETYELEQGRALYGFHGQCWFVIIMRILIMESGHERNAQG